MACDLAALEERLLQLCREHPAGVTNSQLQETEPLVPAADRVAAINSLLARGRLQLFKLGSQLLYQLKHASAPSGGDVEEKVVYGIIEDAGNVGVWVRDIRHKSNLGMTQLNKLLKAMENKKLIKSVSSVAASRKKVYMLYGLEPDQSVTGGAWYSDQDFESEFVEVLNQQCHKFLCDRAESVDEVDPVVARRMCFVSARQVCQFIADLGVSKVRLSVSDIEHVLDTLVFDGKAERGAAENSEDGALYRAVNSPLSSTGLVQIPCGLCPVSDKCSHSYGDVTPLKCLYMSQWLP